MADAEPSPEDDVLAAERRALVRRTLETMTPRERALLLLREEGYSYREMAVALALNESSVGALLMRARAAFREAYDASENAEATRRIDGGF
jgi:RNA polymerase sigma-70 factor (ECF subfamily)